MKEGLDYFSFDVDFFQDKKIQFLSARFGIKGEIFTIKLLCSIYRQGYYIEWDADTALLFASLVGFNGESHGLVNDIVDELFKRGFLDETIFKKFGVLTSAGIQKRYLKACDRRKVVEMVNEYVLTDLEKFKNVEVVFLHTQKQEKCIHDVNISTENVNNSKEDVSKNNQSKVKERKGKESTITEETSVNRMDYKRIQDEYHKHCSRMPKIQELNDKRKATLKAWGDIDQMIEVFKKAGESDFLNGSTGWNSCGFDWIIKPGNRVKILEGNYDNGRKGGTNGSAGKYNLKTEKIG